MEEKKKQGVKWWQVLTGVLVFFVLIGIFTEDSPDTQAPTKQETTQTTQTEEAPAEPVVEKPKQWTKVISLSGNANKRSDIFELTGGKTRLTYELKGNMSMANIYVMEEGSNLEKDGGFAEVTVTETGKDTTFLTKGAGKYYLDISSANGSWSVVIEEEK